VTDFVLRGQLKVRLWRERTNYDYGLPLCDVCGEPLWGGQCAMHESVVRRGVARGWPKEDRVKIFVPCNCHLVCHGTCHMQAHASPDLMVAIQIVRYGMQHIREWIATLPFKVPFHWTRGLDEEGALELVRREAPWVGSAAEPIFCVAKLTPEGSFDTRNRRK